MATLAVRMTFSRESKYAVARNLCFQVLVWVCFVGREFSVAAAAKPFAQSNLGSRAINRLSVAAAVRPTASSSYTGSREVDALSVVAAAELIANGETSFGTVDDLPVTASAEPIELSYGASRALYHEWSVAAGGQPIVRSSRAENELSAAAPQPTARSHRGSRAAKTAAARPIARSSAGSKALGELSVPAAVRPIARSNSDFRAGNRYDSTVGIPTVSKLGPTETTVAWQLPKGPIKKVLVIFEDVTVQPYEFWDHSPSCQQCTGLPEKRKIVIDAIARNYAVLIPHPLDIDGMWEAPDGIWKAFSPNSPDILNILYVLVEWKGVIGLQEDVPTVALGVSSGGETLSTLGLLPGYFESIGMMISPGLAEAFKSSTRDYPPTIFIHMPKDTTTAEKVYYNRKLLSANGVPTKEVRWSEHSVREYWFAELIPGLDQVTSSEIHRRLRELQWLDDTTGLLKPDSDFQNEWFEKIREWNLFPTDLTEGERLMFEDRVFEELNVAYAYHVTLARKNNDLFAWFEGGYEAQERSTNSPPPPVSLFKVASYSPLPVSLFQA